MIYGGKPAQRLWFSLKRRQPCVKLGFRPRNRDSPNHNRGNKHCLSLVRYERRISCTLLRPELENVEFDLARRLISPRAADRGHRMAMPQRRTLCLLVLALLIV